MGELRVLMDRDMTLKNLSERTKKCYLACVHDFVAHYRRNPKELGEEQIKAYLHFLITDRKASQSKVNQVYSALKFFYVVTLQRTWNTTAIPRGRSSRKLPTVLSRQEVEAILGATSNLKYLTIFSTIYSAGLRLGEVVSLVRTDIDAQRMMIRVRQGKGRKDRYTLLCERNLELLRIYWRLAKPREWLFYGKDKCRAISTSSVQHQFRRAVIKAGISKKASIHTLRHSFATHLLETGCDVLHIQKLLGHRSAKTTSVYLHVKRSSLAKICSPLDQLDAKCIRLG